MTGVFKYNHPGQVRRIGAGIGWQRSRGEKLPGQSFGVAMRLDCPQLP
jgi:hypothetical protein